MFKSGHCLFQTRPLGVEKGQYQILQMANPRGWRWVVHLADGTTKTGVAPAKGTALFRAIRTIGELPRPARSGSQPRAVKPGSLTSYEMLNIQAMPG